MDESWFWYARLVSEQRVQKGKFPVVAIGWDTIQALLSSHQAVVEEIYPEHAGDLPKIMAALRALSGADELDQIRRSLIAFAPRSAAVNIEASVWSEVQFETACDLGPARNGQRVALRPWMLPESGCVCQSASKIDHLTASNFDQGLG